jgi:hypothetical protein
MTSCTIRYRLDGPGPSALLVDCGDGLQLVTSGVMEGTMPCARLLAILAERGCDWIPASGEIVVPEREGPAEPPPSTPRLSA